jgi:hypothetical protein
MTPAYPFLFCYRYDTIWDPKLAAEAERRGEDIEGFLSGNHELVAKELRMRLLHMFEYSVSRATIEYQRITKFGGVPTSKLAREEGKKFEKLVKHKKKDFYALSKKLKRSKTDCMIHYYNWKRTQGFYSQMKKEWRNDYCMACDDGGDLIVCDTCEHAYHPECLNPPLETIPKGEWKCPRCEPPKTTRQGRRINRPQTFSPRSPGWASTNRRGRTNARKDIPETEQSPSLDACSTATGPGSLCREVEEISPMVDMTQVRPQFGYQNVSTAALQYTLPRIPVMESSGLLEQIPAGSSFEAPATMHPVPRDHVVPRIAVSNSQDSNPESSFPEYSIIV